MAKKNTVMNPIKAARISAGLTQKRCLTCWAFLW